MCHLEGKTSSSSFFTDRKAFQTSLYSWRPVVGEKVFMTPSVHTFNFGQVHHLLLLRADVTLALASIVHEIVRGNWHLSHSSQSRGGNFKFFYPIGSPPLKYRNSYLMDEDVTLKKDSWSPEKSNFISTPSWHFDICIHPSLQDMMLAVNYTSVQHVANPIPII